MADQENENKRGEIIAVSSAKGGVGKTIIATNLALALKKKNVEVALIDGEFQFGDIGLALDIQPSFTIKDLSEEIDRIDEHNVTNYMTRHESGVHVLSAPDRPEFAELITTEVIQKSLQALTKNFDYIVVDAGHGIKDSTIDFIEAADRVIAVTTLEVSSLKNTKLLIETIHQLELQDKLNLVVNRYNMESLIKPDEVPSMLRISEADYIPNNFKMAAQSMNLGIPLVTSRTKSDISKSIFKMAEGIISNQGGSRLGNKPSIIGKMFSKK
ncbi:AAA family ATPase [Halalkalibacillus sediminis]|nr:AAA family ATPase [Halalkalibacillus sediminis]